MEAIVARKSAALFLNLFVFLFAAAGSVAAQTPQESFVIVGAQLADGSGKPLRAASVRVANGRITKVGEFKPKPGEKIVDAAGLVLAPGFIDTHNHSDRGLESQPLAESQVSQGITTVLLGQDGGSAWPVGEYLERRRKEPPALNLALCVGHATVRRQVMKDDYKRPARAEEVAEMEKLVGQAFSEGAICLSSGLEYEVGSYAATEEVIALAKVAARHKGFYISHIRDEADKTLESMRELVRIGKEAKLPVQNTHVKLGTVGVWGKVNEALAIFEEARRKGVDVTADCYPWDAWASTILVLVPNKRYDDPASVAQALQDVGGAQNVLIVQHAAHPEYEFRNMEEIAKAKGITPVELFIQIVKDGGAGVVCKSMTDDDIRGFYQWRWTMISSDGGIGMRHPRGAGTYPRVLGRFVRERKWLTLEEAVRKMTSLPAWRLKLKDRGRIKKGFAADLVLFNPETVIDNSTFAEPFKLSTGIEKVWVNGTLVWDSGKAPGARPGRVLPH
jgi:N-acyl-D-amino-acid deacylase